jgi:hypothetical protein
MWRRWLWVVAPVALAMGVLGGSREYERLNAVERDVAAHEGGSGPRAPGLSAGRAAEPGTPGSMLLRMSRRLDDLAQPFRAKAMELIARAAEAGIPVLIVDTLRTPQEQAANIAKGVSWTTHSRHLTGHAIDLCPYALFQIAGPDKLAWDADEPAWQTLGGIGERLGLTWGGRWGRGGGRARPDLGHFELKEEQ